MKKKIYNDIARSCFVIPRKVMQLLYVAVTENIWEHAVRWFVFVIIRLWKKTPFRVVIEKCIKIIMCLSFHIDAKTRVSACCRGIHTMRYVTSFIFVNIPTYGLRTHIIHCIHYAYRIRYTLSVSIYHLISMKRITRKHLGWQHHINISETIPFIYFSRHTEGCTYIYICI